MVEITKTQMQKNLEEHERLLLEFEAMFSHVEGEIDYSKLKPKQQQDQASTRTSHSRLSPRSKARRESMLTFEVTDKFGFI